MTTRRGETKQQKDDERVERFTPVSALRELRDHLESAEPISAEAREFILEGLDCWLADGISSLDVALGLKSWGGVSPAKADRLARRNTLLRRLWQGEADWRALAPGAVAHLMKASANRYEADRWPRERQAMTAPAVEPAATWWRILATGEKIPGAKQIANILAGREG
ncbi:hypothetical protein LXM94_23430 [Rhizobium sp. TRM95111]|uniref:hypothetical protein n=1 Tax=Rhizobium alarense TaxID=2846851 RepID=UPI001F407CAA|nr:hypothetical protein [Rhizobium alarense]MCF3642922.1 hypothetical protein [Rhizobium alarense]